MEKISALYYPFSRCLDVDQLKQLLMLFDDVTFLDAVEDDEWRERLIGDLEEEDPRFESYREVAAAIPMLRSEKIVNVVSPETLRAIDSDLTIAATLSDLQDLDWMRSVDPVKFGLVTQRMGSANEQPVWNIFEPKIPAAIAKQMVEGGALGCHLLKCGGSDFAWTLTYAAGSAICMNTHLAAAAELGLAPVTDSRLHHDLLFRKMVRQRQNGSSLGSYDVKLDIQKLVRSAMLDIISDFIPIERLKSVSIEQIMQFRKDTELVRREFFHELDLQFRMKLNVDQPASFQKASAEVVELMQRSLRSYRAEVAAARGRLLPKFMDVANFAAPSASMIGLASGYISSAGYVLAASVAVSALQITKQYLDWKNEYQKLQDTRSSSIAFLSRCDVM